MFASAEATDAEAMLGAQNWALWLLTAAMLHPASEELWKYSELLPHHIPTEAPLNIRLLDPPPRCRQRSRKPRPCRTMP